MKHHFTLTPRDLLFLRDARPMEASDAGLGANWPRPDQLWSALIHAFHRQWRERQPWEGDAHTKRPDAPKRAGSQSLRDNPLSSDRFGALKTAGPFPLVTTTGSAAVTGTGAVTGAAAKSSCSGGVHAAIPTAIPAAGLYYPAPLDLGMELVPSADTDLPAPLTHAFRATTLGKTTPRRWLSAAEYAAYLRAGGAAGADIAAAPDPELYDAERAIGIGIDPETLATESGKFYSAEYLRLRPGVALALAASCDLQPKGAAGTTVDVFQKLPLPHDLIIGGQQGVATLAAAAGADDLLPAPPAIPAGATRLRWTLLTPAIFPALDNHLGGWLPTWIDAATGSVLLKTGDTARRVLAGGRPEPRDAWRARVQQLPAINARLIAARVGKPEAVTGWDLLEKSPKPTLLAVPAGSAYVFDCATGADALALAAALNPPNRRSTLLGEKGYGLGLCAPWQDAGTAQSSPSGGVHAANT